MIHVRYNSDSDSEVEDELQPLLSLASRQHSSADDEGSSHSIELIGRESLSANPLSGNEKSYQSHIVDRTISLDSQNSILIGLNSPVQISPVSPPLPKYRQLSNCPICNINQSIFYCPTCVSSSPSFYKQAIESSKCHFLSSVNKFYFSSCEQETFLNQQEALFSFLKKGKYVKDKITPLTETRAKPSEMYNHIIRLKKRILKTKEYIANLTKTIELDRLSLNAIIRRNKRKSSELERVSQQNFTEYLARCEDRLSAKRDGLENHIIDLVQARRLCLREAQENVFPIIKLPHLDITASYTANRDKTMDLLPHTETRLSIDDDDDDVIGDSNRANSKQEYILIEPTLDQYCILDCVLPPSVNYSSFLKQNAYSTTNKESAQLSRSNHITNTTFTSDQINNNSNNYDNNNNNSTNCILAALSYATQFIQLIAFILDIHLPTAISFKDLCTSVSTLNLTNVCNAAARLDNSIIYIASSQGVPSDLLLRGHTLENLITLLNIKNPRLGHNQPFQPYSEMLLGVKQIRQPRSYSILKRSIHPIITPLHPSISHIIEGDEVHMINCDSDNDSDWEDLEHDVSLAYSTYPYFNNYNSTEMEQSGTMIQSQENLTSKYIFGALSFLWKSTDDK